MFLAKFLVFVLFVLVAGCGKSSSKSEAISTKGFTVESGSVNFGNYRGYVLSGSCEGDGNVDISFGDDAMDWLERFFGYTPQYLSGSYRVDCQDGQWAMDEEIDFDFLPEGESVAVSVAYDGKTHRFDLFKDITPPTGDPTVEPVADVINGDGVQAVALSGTCPEAGMVKVNFDSSTLGIATCVQDSEGGTWSWQLDADFSEVEDGNAIDVRFAFEDPHGNPTTSTAVINLSVEKDVLPPTLEVDALAIINGATTHLEGDCADGTGQVMIALEGVEMAEGVDCTSDRWAYDLSPFDGDEFMAQVSYQDAAGNSIMVDVGPIARDVMAPSLVAVTLEGGNYTPGDILAFGIEFDEAVEVGDADPALTFQVGSAGSTSNYVAQYMEGSGSNTLLFHFAIPAGLLDDDGIGIAAGGLNYNNALSDAAGNPVVANVDSDLAFAEALIVNDAAVVATVSGFDHAAGAKTYKAGEVITVAANFSGNVDIAEGNAPSLNLMIGDHSVVAACDAASCVAGEQVNTLNFSYTVEEGINGGKTSVTGMDFGGVALRLGVLLPVALRGVAADTAAPAITGLSDGSAAVAQASWSWGCDDASLPCGYRFVINQDMSYDWSADDTTAWGSASSAQSDLNAASGKWYLHVQARDSLENAAAVSVSVDIDADAPTLAADVPVEFPAEGSYAPGDVLEYGVTFSEAVQVDASGGTPAMALTIGSNARNANFSRLEDDGLKAIFSYEVSQGDTPGAVVVLGAAIALQGGVIADMAGNAASGLDALVMPDPLPEGILIDTVPTVSSVVRADDTMNSYKVGDEFVINVTFSESVAISGQPALLMSVGNNRVKAIYSGEEGAESDVHSFAYRVEAPANTSSDVSVFSFEEGRGLIADLDENPAILDFAQQDFTGITVDSIFPQATGLEEGLREAAAVSWSWGCSENPCRSRFAITSEATHEFDDAMDLFGSTTSAEETVDLEEEQVYYLHLEVQDGVGNISKMRHFAIRYDSTGPVLSSLASHPGAGTYIYEDALDFVLTFDEVVEVDTQGGVPSLKLRLRASEDVEAPEQLVDASLVEGAGTDTLVFRYQVALGVMDADGIELSNTIHLNGGVMADVSGNQFDPASNMLTVPDLSGVNLDGNAPTVSGVERVVEDGSVITDDQFLKADDSVLIRLSLGQGVILDTSNGSPQLVLQVGDEEVVAPHYVVMAEEPEMPEEPTESGGGEGPASSDDVAESGGGEGPASSDGAPSEAENKIQSEESDLATELLFEYTVLAGHNGANIQALRLELNGAVIQGPTGYVGVAPFAGAALSGLTIDTMAPTFTFARANGETNAVRGDFDFDLAFDGPVALVDVNNFVLSHGSVSNIAGSAGNYTITVSPPSDFDGSMDVAVVGDSFQDLAGNMSAEQNVQVDVDVDTKAPTISSIGRPGGSNSVVTRDFQVEIVFSEVVRMFDQGDLVVSNGTAPNAADFAGDSDSYTVTIRPRADFEGNVSVSLNPASVEDIIGNTGSGAPEAISVTADTDAPEAVIVRRGNGLPAKQQEWDVSCNNQCNSFKQKIILATATCDADALTGEGWFNGATRPFSKTTGDGEYNICVVARDSHGNESAPTMVASEKATLDNTGPTVESVAFDGSGVVNGPFDVRVTFSEAVQNFVDSDVAVDHGSAGTPVKDPNNDRIYTVSIAPNAGHVGPIEVSVNGSSVEDDPAGNVGSGSDSVTVQVDLVGPTATLAYSGASPVNAPFDVTVSFDEDIDESTFAAADFTVTNGTAGAPVADPAGDGAYDVTITPNPGLNGKIVKVTLNTSGVKDAAGNDGTGAPFAEVTVDNVGPTLVSVTGSDDVQTGPFDVTVTFSEEVTGFSTANFSVSNGSASSPTHTGGGVYTVRITPNNDLDGQIVGVSVGSAGVTDSLGNAASGTGNVDVTVDNKGPTVVSVSYDGGANANGDFLVWVTFSEEIKQSSFTADDISVTNGTAGAPAKQSAIVYNVMIDPTNNLDGENVQVTVNASEIEDMAGNTGSGAVSKDVLVDSVVPTVTIVRSGDGSPAKTGSWNISCTDTDGCSYKAVVISQGATCNASTLSSVTDWSALSPADYTINENSGDGEFTVCVSAKDDADNVSDPADTDDTIVLDNTSPTPSVARVGDGSAAKQQSWNVSCNDTNSSHGCSYKAKAISSGASCDTSTLSSVSWSEKSTAPEAYGQSTGDGDYSLCVIARDAAGNESGYTNPTGSGQYATLDNTGPTVSIYRDSSTGTETGESFTVRVDFTEVVEGFNLSDITAENAGELGMVGVAGHMGQHYRVTVHPDDDTEGDLVITLNLSGVTDGAGNAASGTGTLTVPIDTKAPELAFRSNKSGPAKKGNRWYVDCTNEDCDAKGVVLATGSTCDASALSESSWTTSGDTEGWLKNDGDGEFYLCAEARDAHGNTTGPTPGDAYFTLDNSGPVITLTSNPESFTGTTPFTLNIVFDEEVSGFTVEDISVTDGTKGTLSTETEGTAYSVQITPNASVTSVTVSIAADSVMDTLNHGNAVASLTVNAASRGDRKTAGEIATTDGSRDPATVCSEGLGLVAANSQLETSEFCAAMAPEGLEAEETITALEAQEFCASLADDMALISDAEWAAMALQHGASEDWNLVGPELTGEATAVFTDGEVFFTEESVSAFRCVELSAE